jgi:hypothetical protein
MLFLIETSLTSRPSRSCRCGSIDADFSRNGRKAWAGRRAKNILKGLWVQILSDESL